MVLQGDIERYWCALERCFVKFPESRNLRSWEFCERHSRHGGAMSFCTCVFDTQASSAARVGGSCSTAAAAIPTNKCARFCSVCYDTDKFFGSEGNFFQSDYRQVGDDFMMPASVHSGMKPAYRGVSKASVFHSTVACIRVGCF